MNLLNHQRSNSWSARKEKSQNRRRTVPYVVLTAEGCENYALRLQDMDSDRFRYFPINWGKFPDGTDDITISGFTPSNEIAGEHVLFFASFHNNDVTLSQFSVLIVLLQSFIQSLTIVLPFYPVGTMERVDVEGKVATANTYSILLSNLPTTGVPNRIMIYDIHALQIRFYFHGATIPSLHTSIPLLLERITDYSPRITAVAFPDDGAAKRFSSMFARSDLALDIIICGKVRDGDSRKITIQDGDPAGKVILIVDDLVQTGGTLYQCALALLEAGGVELNCFVTHGVFPNETWREFCKNGITTGSKAVFNKFWVTNSIPIITNQLPTDDVFEVIDLLPQIVEDLYLNN